MKSLPPRVQLAIETAAHELHAFPITSASSVVAATQARFPSPEACRRWLRKNGINLREFCDQHGVSYQAARELLSGKAKAFRGESHKAAVALGLKPDPSTLTLAA